MSDEVKVTMSASVGAIGAALAKAQLEARPAVKDARNPHFKNNYASLASCVEALRPFHEHGIAVLQPPAVYGADGVLVTTLLVHSSGEWIRGELYMPASKKDPQGFGSALSYARRYCLTATVGLATDDDDGEEAVRGSRSEPDLSRKLSASIDWPEWEAKQVSKLRGARSMGELQEIWSEVYVSAKSSPNGAAERLSDEKNAMKATLASRAGGGAAAARP